MTELRKIKGDTVHGKRITREDHQVGSGTSRHPPNPNFRVRSPGTSQRSRGHLDGVPPRHTRISTGSPSRPRAITTPRRDQDFGPKTPNSRSGTRPPRASTHTPRRRGPVAGLPIIPREQPTRRTPTRDETLGGTWYVELFL